MNNQMLRGVDLEEVAKREQALRAHVVGLIQGLQKELYAPLALEYLRSMIDIKSEPDEDRFGELAEMAKMASVEFFRTIDRETIDKVMG